MKLGDIFKSQIKATNKLYKSIKKIDGVGELIKTTHGGEIIFKYGRREYRIEVNLVLK